MANLETYQEAIQSLLTDISSQSISDSGNNHHRVYGCVLHIDIKERKAWVQNNGTEWAIADDLMERRVLTQDIVLGFYSLSKRKSIKQL
jgi:hypothetical protein